LESLTAGESVTDVKLRHGDLLFDLQTTFNQYLASLRTLQSENDLPPQIESQIAKELEQMHAEIQAACTPTNSTNHNAVR
jgi:hypothetical protein